VKYLTIQKQKGVGLIEVLIATVVIAIGLLGVASLQTGFLSGSGDNKARAEALVLAEQKLEELRNNAEIGTLADAAVAECTGVNIGLASGYRSLCPGAPTETIGGTNASFTRTWTITNSNAFLTSAPARRNISVQVSWDSDGGIDSDNADGDNDETTDIIDANEKVNVVTEMAWIDPADSALYASQNGSGGTGAVPSPRQNASENVASENVIGTDLVITDMNETAGTAGIDSQVQIDPDNSGTLITLSQVATGSHFYTVTHSVLSTVNEGVIAVFLCNDADNDSSNPDTCSHIQNHFGGVVLSLKGTVYSSSGNGLTGILAAWSSSDVNDCYNAPPGTTSGLDSRVYECIFAGNCNATGAANSTRTASGSGATNEGCFVESEISDSMINSRGVGAGGEFGNAGLLGLDGGNGGDQLCFLEDTPDWSDPKNVLNGNYNSGGGNIAVNEDYLLPVSARFYVSRRMMSDGSQKSEGINRSYVNHNFLIVSRVNSPNAYKNCFNEVASSPALLKLASRDIIKTTGVNLNTVESTASFSGTMPAITIQGSITGARPTLYISKQVFTEQEGACYVKNNNLLFACVVPSNAGDVTIKGGSSVYPSPTVADPATSVLYKECSRTVSSSEATGLAPGTTCNWTGDFI